eukprot:TRINITY_DN214_c0_g2_i1.p1 TRINITY_DN214_c0_g2~~TRINITY_DN214_c0_g2_i1.p1  ORF type:complete len:224 (+),score=63.01 TRINITY_DN214_c0_g2_i1:109-780(+)
MSENQTPILSEERVKDLTTQFQNLDPEKKGLTSSSNFETLIKGAGFNFSNPKVVENLKTFYVSSDEFYYGQFLQLISFLTAIKDSFENLDTNKSGKVSNSKIQEFLKVNGYEFNEAVAKACSIVADRELTGSFDLTGAVGVIIYLQFVMVHFTQADTSGDGKLQFDEIKTKFDYLGVHGLTEENAKKFFEEADSDKSGEIDPEEFVQLVIRIKFPEKFKQLCN